MDPERVQAFFGDKHQFTEIDKLRDIARVRVPVDAWPGGDLTQQLSYGNHSSAHKVSDAVWEQKRRRTWRATGRLVSQICKQSRYRDCGCPQLG